VHPQKFADNAKLKPVVDKLEGQDAFQRDLDKLEKWACLNLMKLHMGWGNPWCQYRLEDEGIEGSPEEKHLGVLVDDQRNGAPLL